ncbi:dihydrodipicolinate synthase family protein [Paenibacillus sp. UNC451MF]|uniref:dihydrodipicolinate synthase family protein n=1 Tax=Paenibacillus sp. UNC451MF TaxID=1449063 RepID=UPI00048CA043|nr:dihydrodipicolinate synthase family protein [Paenibacillus sp. UNC451MF]
MPNPHNLSFFKGVYALLLTPFASDGSIDWDVYERYVDWQLAQHPHHLFAVCGSSEMLTLHLDERLRLAKTAVQQAGSTPVVVTANLEGSLEEQIEEVQQMEQTGVTGLVLTTKGMGNDQDQLLSYLFELASHTSLPILMYEFPGHKPHHMHPETYRKLIESGRFVGIKDTTCTQEGIQSKIDVAPDSVVLQANIPWLLDSLRTGAGGIMATPSTAAAGLHRKLWDEASSGSNAAEDTHAQLVSLSAMIGSSFPATAKYLVSCQGIPMTTVTRTKAELSSEQYRALQVWYEWAVRQQIMNAAKLGI